MIFFCFFIFAWTAYISPLSDEEIIENCHHDESIFACIFTESVIPFVNISSDCHDHHCYKSYSAAFQNATIQNYEYFVFFGSGSLDYTENPPAQHLTYYPASEVGDNLELYLDSIALEGNLTFSSTEETKFTLKGNLSSLSGESTFIVFDGIDFELEGGIEVYYDDEIIGIKIIDCTLSIASGSTFIYYQGKYTGDSLEEYGIIIDGLTIKNSSISIYYNERLVINNLYDESNSFQVLGFDYVSGYLTIDNSTLGKIDIGIPESGYFRINGNNIRGIYASIDFIQDDLLIIIENNVIRLNGDDHIYFSMLGYFNNHYIYEKIFQNNTIYCEGNLDCYHEIFPYYYYSNTYAGQCDEISILGSVTIRNNTFYRNSNQSISCLHLERSSNEHCSPTLYLDNNIIKGNFSVLLAAKLAGFAYIKQNEFIYYDYIETGETPFFIDAFELIEIQDNYLENINYLDIQMFGLFKKNTLKEIGHITFTLEFNLYTENNYFNCSENYFSFGNNSNTDKIQFQYSTYDLNQTTFENNIVESVNSLSNFFIYDLNKCFFTMQQNTIIGKDVSDFFRFYSYSSNTIIRGNVFLKIGACNGESNNISLFSDYTNQLISDSEGNINFNYNFIEAKECNVFSFFDSYKLISFLSNETDSIFNYSLGEISFENNVFDLSNSSKLERTVDIVGSGEKPIPYFELSHEYSIPQTLEYDYLGEERNVNKDGYSSIGALEYQCISYKEGFDCSVCMLENPNEECSGCNVSLASLDSMCKECSNELLEYPCDTCKNKSYSYENGCLTCSNESYKYPDCWHCSNENYTAGNCSSCINGAIFPDCVEFCDNGILKYNSLGKLVCVKSSSGFSWSSFLIVLLIVFICLIIIVLCGLIISLIILLPKMIRKKKKNSEALEMEETVNGEVQEISKRNMNVDVEINPEPPLTSPTETKTPNDLQNNTNPPNDNVNHSIDISKIELDNMLEIDPKIIKVGNVINSGTFGVIKKGKMIIGEGEVPIAIKQIVISEQVKKEDTMKEVKTMISIKHENILRCFGCFCEENECNIIMELAETDLLELKKNKELSLKEKINYLIQIAEGMNYLHDKTIIHRDLKPQNILIVNKKAKICDFGSSKRIASIQQTFCGTIEYISPEMFDPSIQGDLRCIDIFSFGVLGWEFLVGEVPYSDLREQNKSDFEILNSICKENVRPDLNHEKLKNVPQELKIIIENCWEEKPNDRYQSFKEILKELKSIKIE